LLVSHTLIHCSFSPNSKNRLISSLTLRLKFKMNLDIDHKLIKNTQVLLSYILPLSAQFFVYVFNSPNKRVLLWYKELKWTSEMNRTQTSALKQELCNKNWFLNNLFVSFSQFHQHFMSSFCADILYQKITKPKCK